MSLQTKIKPIGDGAVMKGPNFQPEMREMPKSQLMQLFEPQFSLQNISVGDQSLSGSDSDEFEPSSICLRKLVQNYIEDPNNGKQWCDGRNNCSSCINGSSTDSSSEEEEERDYSSDRFLQSIKNMIFCVDISEGERNLVTKITEIVEKNNHDLELKSLVEKLVDLGYDATICKSRWERSRKHVCPSGEYEYMDVMIEGTRVLIDVDFRSKFKIARPTKLFEAILQTLPYVFVGQRDQLKKVVVAVSKSVKKSMKKRGLLVPPWRRAEYVLIKWFAPYVRAKQSN